MSKDVIRKPTNWWFLVITVPAQFALVYLFTHQEHAEIGLPLQGPMLSLLYLLIGPSMLVWLICWLIFQSKSVLLNLIILACVLGIPIFLYQFFRHALQGFSH